MEKKFILCGRVVASFSYSPHTEVVTFYDRNDHIIATIRDCEPMTFDEYANLFGE